MKYIPLTEALYDYIVQHGHNADPVLAELARETAALGPIASPYGLHLVWIEERLPPATLPFAAVETRALHQYLDDRSDERLRDHLRTWRARYDVRIEP